VVGVVMVGWLLAACVYSKLLVLRYVQMC
jgi:hypothetical protein